MSHTHKHLRFLPKYSHARSNTHSDGNVAIGSGVKNVKAFQIERTNSDMRGTNILAGNQSGSTITSGGGAANAAAFGNISFGKKKKAIFK